MKIKSISIIFIYLFFNIYYCFSKNLLTSIFEFDSPTTNPWGLCYDGENLWLSDDNTGTIYKCSTTGQVLDSITITNTKITGVDFINNDLWGVNTDIIKDTMINESLYPVFCLYKIDKTNGTKIDSICIVGSSVSLQSGFLWGLCYFNAKLYISYNGGWGPCLIELNPETKEYQELCCTHLCGMTVINDTIVAIRHNSMESMGNYIATVYSDATGEIKRYDLDLYATDLTYDNQNIWIVDRNSKKILKMDNALPSTNTVDIIAVNETYKPLEPIIIEATNNDSSNIYFSICDQYPKMMPSRILKYNGTNWDENKYIVFCTQMGPMGYWGELKSLSSLVDSANKIFHPGTYKLCFNYVYDAGSNPDSSGIYESCTNEFTIEEQHTGFEKNVIDDIYKIYPNPVKNGEPVYIRMKSNHEKIYISLFNINGIKVYEYYPEKCNELIEINTSKLPIGLYYLNIIFDNKKESETLIIN